MFVKENQDRKKKDIKYRFTCGKLNSYESTVKWRDVMAKTVGYYI